MSDFALAPRSHVERDVVAAFSCLGNNTSWCAMLAENLYWASCEALVQSALLHTFNAASSNFVADRERALVGSMKPDLVVLDRSDHDAWWNAREHRDQLQLRRLVQAVVQLKVAWTKGNASGSAVVTEKAKRVRDDVEGLLRLQQSFPTWRLFWAVLIGGFHESGRGGLALDDAEAILRAGLRREHGSKDIQTVTILDDMSLDHWKPHREVPLASARLLWARLPGE